MYIYIYTHIFIYAGMTIVLVHNPNENSKIMVKIEFHRCLRLEEWAHKARAAEAQSRSCWACKPVENRWSYPVMIYWLVVSAPLINMIVNWDDYFQYMGKYKSCSKAPTSLSWFITAGNIESLWRHSPDRIDSA